MDSTGSIISAIEMLRSDFNEFRQDLREYLFLSRQLGGYSGQYPRTEDDKKIDGQYMSAFYQKIFSDWNSNNLETLGVESDPSQPFVLVHKSHPAVGRMLGSPSATLVPHGQLFNGSHYKFERGCFKNICDAIRESHHVETHTFIPSLANKPADE